MVKSKWSENTNAVQVRTDTVVMEDGEELSRKYHRHTLMPDAVITSENAEVQAVCNAVWTDQVKADYEKLNQIIQRNNI